MKKKVLIILMISIVFGFATGYSLHHLIHFNQKQEEMVLLPEHPFYLLDEVNEEVAKIQGAADELVSSLDPHTSPVGAYLGRDGSYLTAGMLTNVVYGFLLASFIIFAALPLLMRWGVL